MTTPLHRHDDIVRLFTALSECENAHDQEVHLILEARIEQLGFDVHMANPHNITLFNTPYWLLEHYNNGIKRAKRELSKVFVLEHRTSMDEHIYLIKTIESVQTAVDAILFNEDNDFEPGEFEVNFAEASKDKGHRYHGNDHDFSLVVTRKELTP